MAFGDATRAQIEVWCDNVDAPSAEADRLFSELERAGVRCYPVQPGGSSPGVVLFDAVSDELRARLYERSRASRERTIAVSVRRMPLPPEAAWEVLRAGAADIFSLGVPATVAAAIAARFQRWSAVDAVLESPVVRRNLVGDSIPWRLFLRRIIDVAKFSTSAVLIRGESGTGKELVARLFHTLDGRADKRELVVLDCTTVVPELSGSEFFGHERGAYTGAVGARDGVFALADGGTLFLDEVGELPPRLQAELLRVVQEGTYKRVGGNTWQRTRFRLLCATHRDLEREMRLGRFRADFYYRLAAWTCMLPPLRQRRDDIPALARHFLQSHYSGDAPPFDETVIELLTGRDYPGNVRDLRHLVDRIAYRHAGGGPITLGDVPEEERPEGTSEPAPWAADDLFEHAARLALLRGMRMREIGNAAADASVRLALDLEQGNVGRAAERLGITDRAVQKRRAVWRGREARNGR